MDDTSSALFLPKPPSLIVHRTRRRLFAHLLGSFGVLVAPGILAARVQTRRRKRHRTRRCDARSPSGIRGTVLIGPMCPVEQPDHPCPDQPFAATLRIEDLQETVLCSTRSNDDGQFRVGLPPDVYELVPVGPNPGAPPHAAPLRVMVERGGYTSVTVIFDSGIRAMADSSIP